MPRQGVQRGESAVHECRTVFIRLYVAPFVDGNPHLPAHQTRRQSIVQGDRLAGAISGLNRTC